MAIVIHDYTVTVADITGGHRLTVTRGSEVQTVDVMSKSGGGTGGGGADGFSPIIEITEISGGHRLTVTDVNGTESFDVLDGAAGATGPAGAPGKTAYQYAQDGGYTGSEAEFSAMLANKLDYTVYGLPMLYLTGDTSAMTKDNAVNLSYEYGDQRGTCSVKWQGSSSLGYPKKNYTIKFDTAFEVKEGWGEQTKYCLKANFIDHSHARNVGCATLWGKVVKSRAGVSEALSSLPNGGAIDGFPCIIMLNGEFHGLYTWNIPKDGWMYEMDKDGEVTETEVLAFDTYVEVDSEDVTTGAYTPATKVTGYHFRKMSTVTGGRTGIRWDSNKIQGFNVRAILFDSNNKPYKLFCAHNGTTLSPYWGKFHGDLGMDAWLDVTQTGNADFLVPDMGQVTLPVPDGGSVRWEVFVTNEATYPDGTLTTTWSAEAERNNTWVYTWVKTGIEAFVEYSVSAAYDHAAIFGADTTSEATRFLAPATLSGDFDLEYATDEDNADWALTSLNRLINACINSDGSDLDTTIAQYLDWDSAIDYYAYCCAVGGADMAGKNYLLYTFDGTKWGFGAYDMDSTFGLWWNGKTFLRENHYPTIQWYADYHRVMKLILTYKKDAFKARYAELRAGALSEGSVAEAFSNFIAQIPAPVYTADAEKWPTIPSTAANNLSQILNWYRMRVAVLDKEIEAL